MGDLVSLVTYGTLALIVVTGVVALLWFLLWKFVLEKNEAVRDFFDLDPIKKKR